MTWWMPLVKIVVLALVEALIDRWVPEPYAHRTKAVLRLAVATWSLVKSFRQAWRTW